MLICLVGSGNSPFFFFSLVNFLLFLGKMLDSAARIVSFVWKKVTVSVIFRGYFGSKFHLFLEGNFGICKINSVYYLLKKASKVSVFCFWI